MARAVPKHIVVGLIAALTAAAIPVGSVIAAQSAAPEGGPFRPLGYFNVEVEKLVG